MDNTEFAKRMKKYEKEETQTQFDTNLPIIIRLDGKGFSKFTKPFARPFDFNFRDIMARTAVYVMNNCGGSLCYTQSDEISIIIDRPDVFFNGKKHKIISVLASMATSFFTIEAMKLWPEHVKNTVPVFDCRAFNVPSRDEAINSILWRQKDCIRNAVSMLGHYHFSKSDMHKKSASEVRSMLKLRKDIDWDSVDNAFRYGIYSYRTVVNKEIDDATWNNIPVESRPNERVAQRRVTHTETLNNPNFYDIKNIVYGHLNTEEISDD